jgi:hypothetical protein
LFNKSRAVLSSEIKHEQNNIARYAIITFISFHVIFLVARLNQGHVADIGDTTLKSAQLLFGGLNPYESEIDSVALSYMGPGFGGFKYLPIMTLIYAPLGLLLDYRGIQVTNLILNLVIAFLIFDIVKEHTKSNFYARLSVVVYLSPFLIFSLLYAKGVTDQAPVLLMLLAFKLREKFSFLSGLALGLSISSKLLPGLILIPILFNGELRSRYILGGILGLVPIFIAALISPLAIYNNIILFNLMRPIPESSWVLLFSDSGLIVIKLILISSLTLIYVSGLLKNFDLGTRFVHSTLVIILSILLSADTPQNYNLWWIPLLICGSTLVVYRRRLSNLAEPDRRHEIF